MAFVHLQLEDGHSSDGRALIVRGDSGTGKTFFARELMDRLGEAESDALFLFIDIANDEYQSARTIASLLKLSLVAGPMTGTSRISVPENLTLARYRRQTRQRGRGRGLLRAVAQAIGAAVGLGTAVSAVLSNNGGQGGPLVEDELAAYFSWVAKRAGLVLAIDNIQFLNLDVRLTIESVLQRVDRGIRLLAVDRTVTGISELEPPLRCFADAQLEVDLTNLTLGETKELVAGALGEEVEAVGPLAEDIFVKSEGLPKDVEYCLRRYVLELGRGAPAGAIEGLLATIDRLPLIHRQFLVIAALLDGGVKRAIARGTVSRLVSAYDTHQLDDVVDDLVARDYLRLNSESGDRLRPGHERIVTAIRDLADDELQEEVRRSLIEELAIALEAPSGDESEIYLLHCLVGLQTARELARNVHQISRLIQSAHRQDQFSYLVAISDELHDILPLLPEHVLNDLLDAMQKSSSFDRGLQIVQRLDSSGVPGMAERRIYRLKYLTQAYRYDEALALSEEVGPEEWGAVYRINAFMSLDRDDEALELADANLSAKMSECQAILRRNTITLYDVETALRHLDEAYRFFEPEESAFRLATIDTNRSLVYLHAKRFGDALRCLDRAVAGMHRARSAEIYQAQLNLGIRAALLGDHVSALEALTEAAVHVPRALLLDQVKIETSRLVVECVSGQMSPPICEKALSRCLDHIRGVQMPYLRRVLRINLEAARGEVSPRNASTGRVSLTADLTVESVTWQFPMSIHWRY
jgi:tetratricopeptide (TPR) repeat protein